MVQPVTDPAILEKLNATDQPVTDPKILAKLNAPSIPSGGSTRPSNATLAGVSSAIENSPVGKAMQAVGSTSAMQPLGISDVMPTMATGDPVQDTLNTTRQILEFPSRLSQNLGELSGPVSDVAATHLGAMGLEPHIAAALGMAAGMAVDPRTFVVAKGENLKGTDLPKVGADPTLGTSARVSQAEKYGINLSPAEATQSKLYNVLEDLGNIYPYTGDDFQNFYQTRLAQADNIRTHLLESVGNNVSTKKVSEMMRSTIDDYLDGATPEQAAYLQDRMGDLDTFMKKPAAGQFTHSMLAQQRKIALDSAGAPFDALRAIVPEEAPIKTSSFAQTAKKFLEQELQGKQSDRSAQWISRLKEYAGIKEEIAPTMEGQPISGPLADAIKKAMGGTEKEAEAIMPYGATQMTMRKLRDLRISNDPGYLLGIKGQGNTYAGYAAELRKALHEDIEGGLNTLSDQAKQVLKEQPPTSETMKAHLEQMGNVSEMYKTAKTNYAQTKELMNDPFIIKLLKNNPEDFMNHAVKAQDITNIGKLKEILGPENFVPVQHNLLANMLVDKTGELNPKSFVNKVDKIGFPTLTKVFDPQTMYEIGQAQEVFSNMKRGFAEGSQTGGRLMAKAALFGVPAQAFHLIMSGEPLSAVGVLAGSIGLPKALARMYLSPVGRELLIKGMIAPQEAATALSVLGKGAMMSGIQNAKASAEPAVTQ